jgi:uncharacterized membrane protein
VADGVSFAALATLAAVVVHSVARDVRAAGISSPSHLCSAAATVLAARTLASGDQQPSAVAFTI